LKTSVCVILSIWLWRNSGGWRKGDKTSYCKHFIRSNRVLLFLWNSGGFGKNVISTILHTFINWEKSKIDKCSIISSVQSIPIKHCTERRG